MKQDRKNAQLVLEDGSTFKGYTFGATEPATGEVVFNTGMVGYPESLTDPSYCGQILVFTYPLIGNYGIPGHSRKDDLLQYFESEKIQVRGLIVNDYSQNYSHWNAEKSLNKWLIENHTPAIYGIDTRKLTKQIREKGTMLGKIVYSSEKLDFEDPNKNN